MKILVQSRRAITPAPPLNDAPLGGFSVFMGQQSFGSRFKSPH
jgi:hypothetical protein